ncbi:MAG: YitT family protein [Firmicutes bacterium]|nr:YitT family protein [Bacillota bacterium]
MKEKIKDWIISIIGLTVGAALAAAALENFLIPVKVLDGGLNGIGMIINFLTGAPLSILVFVLNIPFFIIGFIQLGKEFIIKYGYGIIAFTLLLEQFKHMGGFTHDQLLAPIFGGVILGIGVGMVIRSGGCIDGTEMIAILINKKTSLSVGQTIFCFNVVIYTVAGFLFGWDRTMYSLLTYFITSRLIDIVENGFSKAKSVMIITNDGRKIADEIYARLGRTVTSIEGEGMISGKKVVLYCVITQLELREIKKIVREADESAFVTVSDVSEIVGAHIKKNNMGIDDGSQVDGNNQTGGKAAKAQI